MSPRDEQIDTAERIERLSDDLAAANDAIVSLTAELERFDPATGTAVAIVGPDGVVKLSNGSYDAIAATAAPVLTEPLARAGHGETFTAHIEIDGARGRRAFQLYGEPLSRFGIAAGGMLRLEELEP